MYVSKLKRIIEPFCPRTRVKTIRIWMVSLWVSVDSIGPGKKSLIIARLSRLPFLVHEVEHMWTVFWRGSAVKDSLFQIMEKLMSFQRDLDSIRQDNAVRHAIATLSRNRQIGDPGFEVGHYQKIGSPDEDEMFAQRYWLAEKMMRRLANEEGLRAGWASEDVVDLDQMRDEMLFNDIDYSDPDDDRREMAQTSPSFDRREQPGIHSASPSPAGSLAGLHLNALSRPPITPANPADSHGITSRLPIWQARQLHHPLPTRSPNLLRPDVLERSSVVSTNIPSANLHPRINIHPSSSLRRIGLNTGLRREEEMRIIAPSNVRPPIPQSRSYAMAVRNGISNPGQIHRAVCAQLGPAIGWRTGQTSIASRLPPGLRDTHIAPSTSIRPPAPAAFVPGGYIPPSYLATRISTSYFAPRAPTPPVHLTLSVDSSPDILPAVNIARPDLDTAEFRSDGNDGPTDPDHTS